MPKVKKKRKVGLLNGQKPRLFRRIRNYSRWTLRLIVVGVLSFGGWKIYLYFSRPTLHQTILAETDLVFSPSDLPMHIRQTAKSILIAQSKTQDIRDVMQRSAIAVRRSLSAESVTLTKMSRDKIHVTIVLRKPKLVIFYDKPRYVDSSGSVYGLASFEEPTYDELHGLYLRGTPIEFMNDGTILLPSDQRRALLNALELQRDLIPLGLGSTSMHFDPYTGLRVHVNSTDTSITFGQPPFEDKVRELKKILSGLHQSHKVAARIELDYNGKVFIKYKL